MVADSGRLETHDAVATTSPGKSLWLLSCTPSQTYVLYQANCEEELPVDLTCPVGRVQAERFPFGKLVLRRDKDTVVLEADASFKPYFHPWVHMAWQFQRIGALPSNLILQTDAPKVKALVNGDAREPHKETRNGKTVWVIKPYDVNKKVPPMEWQGARPIALPVNP